MDVVMFLIFYNAYEWQQLHLFSSYPCTSLQVLFATYCYCCWNVFFFFFAVYNKWNVWLQFNDNLVLGLCVFFSVNGLWHAYYCQLVDDGLCSRIHLDSMAWCFSPHDPPLPTRSRNDETIENGFKSVRACGLHELVCVCVYQICIIVFYVFLSISTYIRK